MLNKPTVVIGASPNAERYSYKATINLQEKQHTVYPIGIRKGKIGKEDIITERVVFKNINTVTLYVGADKHKDWAEYIYALNPKRVIFNPGTENPEFEKELENRGIEALEACTLVLLSIGKY